MRDVWYAHRDDTILTRTHVSALECLQLSTRLAETQAELGRMLSGAQRVSAAFPGTHSLLFSL